MLHKLNFKIQVPLFQKSKAKRKNKLKKQTNNSNKNNKSNKKQMIFHKQFTCFYVKNLLTKHQPPTLLK